MSHILVIPHTPMGLCPATFAFGVVQGAKFEQLIDAGDAAAAFQRYWTPDSGDLVVVSEDVLPESARMTSLLSCRRAWCICMAEDLGAVVTRWSERLVRRHADFADLVKDVQIEGGDSTWGTWAWSVYCNEVARRLRALGYSPHVHGEVSYVGATP